MTDGPVVVKIGGSTLGSHDTTLKDMVALQRDGVKLIVVHGGGTVISEWMQRQGTMPRFVRGLRVTSAESLEVVTAVLSGLVNTQLVASVMALGGKALGLSGADGGLLEASIADEELGYVGEVTRVNPQPILQALEGGYIPLVAPVGMHCADGSHYSGSLLNINGDTVAGELAHALEAERLIFLTDVGGIMDAGGRVIRRLDRRRADLLSRSGIIQGGMIPKLAACLRALERSPMADIIDGRRPGALLECVRGLASGTTIIGDTFMGRSPGRPS